MNFNDCKLKIKDLLITKASNNFDREAMITLKELELSTKATTELTQQFVAWLLASDWVEDARMEGKGLVICHVKNNIQIK